MEGSAITVLSPDLSHHICEAILINLETAEGILSAKLDRTEVETRKRPPNFRSGVTDSKGDPSHTKVNLCREVPHGRLTTAYLTACH